MKKNLLIPVSAIFISGSVMAQSKTLVPIKNKAVANTAVKVPIVIQDVQAGSAETITTNTAGNQLRSVTLTNLGTSTYQLQTNNAVQNRIVANADGTISAAFTFSGTGSSWPDRGTGYVYYDGTSWSAAPSAKIEPVRTGWPSLLVLGDNSEATITHATAPAPGNLYLSKRATKGSGAFTHNGTIIASTASYGNYWPRAVVGGPTNNTIHLISISNPTDGAATPAPIFFHGQQGCLTYSRSLDGGTTWDKLHTVPAELDSSHYYGFSADCYAIDARGNTIAYIVGGDYVGLILMKSLDNGSTWTKTQITSFPIPFFNDQLTDVPPTDGIADTIDTNDGNVALIIDENDDVHVWAGRMRVLDDVAGDGQSSYFPGTDGLMYWNENMGASAPVDIAGMEDTDGDLAITISAWGTYYSSLTSQPSVGIDATGTLHLTYSSVVEYTDYGDGKSFRNIYYMSSPDHGTTWTTPVRLSADDFSEQVFCSVARTVDPTCVKVIYQADGAPGVGVTSTSADYANNTGVIDDQWYGCVTPVLGQMDATNLSEFVGMFPNPSNTIVNISTLNSIEKIDVYNTMGARVMSVAPNANSTTLNVANLTNGMYLVNIKTGGKTISKPLIKE